MTGSSGHYRVTEPTPTIEFIDLQAQRQRIGDEIDRAIDDVLAHGRFINGPEVARFESMLAARYQHVNVVACASGTDALVLALLALGVGPGDAVFVPSFTFAATAEAPALLGATPFFVDVDDATFNMSVTSLMDSVEHARELNLRPATVVAVDLFGNPADYRALNAAAAHEGLTVIDDAAQSLGGRTASGPVGSLAAVTTTSFFPAKPLGCYGDGGAVLTTDDSLDEVMRSLRQHGTGDHKYDHVRVGMNARMDTLQAAILLVKLTVFDAELQSRQEVAARYSSGLGDNVQIQLVPEGNVSAWAQYTIMVQGRERLIEHLRAAGIPTAVYYPLPLHLQPAYESCPRAPAGLAVSEDLAKRSLSLPFHPYLTDDVQERVIAEVLAGSTR